MVGAPKLFPKLFLKSKILSLKAIHNLFDFVGVAKMIVSKVKDTKFESNSQPSHVQAGIKCNCF